MANFSHYPLQKALYQKLIADGALMGIVVGIFDRPPQGGKFPYITIGESTGSDWSTKTTAGMQHLVMIHIWSREGGRSEAALIMENIHRILHDAAMTVTGQTVVLMRFVASELTLESDGWTYQGRMRLRILLEAN